MPSVCNTEYPKFEIIVSDNNSKDESVAWIKQHYPDVKVVELDQNYGYCGGNNRAVSHATGDILLFLNNDVKVEKNWLHPLNQTFTQYPGAKVVQPKLRDLKKPDYFEYAGAAGGFIDNYGYPFCRGRIFDTLEKDRGQYDDHTEIFWASGAAMAVRKPHFEQLKGFDEDFEFHMEEIDFCWRTWNRGGAVRYNPESTVYHLGGGSLPMGHPRKVRYNFRNSLIMLMKNLPDTYLLRRLPVRLLLDLIAALHAVLTGNFGDFKAIIQAHIDFWSTFGLTRTKRETLKKELHANTHPISKTPIKNRMLIYEYFLKGKTTYRQLFSE